MEQSTVVLSHTHTCPSVPLHPLLSSWKNVDSDMLCCEKCKSVVAVTYPLGLSSFATDRLTRLYEEQLASAHLDFCPFRKEALHWESATTNVAESGSNIIPAMFASFVPANLLGALESRLPLRAFYAQMKDMTSDGIAWETISFERPSSLERYRPDEFAESTEETTLGNLIIDCLMAAGFSMESIPRARAEVAVLLTLLGWTAQSSNEADSVLLECQLCLKSISVRVSISEEDRTKTPSPVLEKDEEPSAKRQRPMGNWNPLSSHRHYCPYSCGFCQKGLPSVPIWQSLANRLLLAPTEKTKPEDTAGTGLSTWAQVRALLNAGIVRTGQKSATTA
jgi:hypothetical protein